MKGSLSGFPALLLCAYWEYPVPSLQNMMVLSFSLPERLGSKASKVPSSSSNCAFSYFQGLPVNRSRSFPETFLLEQPVVKTPAVRLNMIHLQNIRLSIFG